VVDERGELFPGTFFSSGCCTDVLQGCEKGKGIEMVLRTMGPECIAVDEITAEKDCDALIRAAGCGVSLMATAHASSLEDFSSRKIYAPLIHFSVFNHILILRKDKSWYLERRKPCIINGLGHC